MNITAMREELDTAIGYSVELEEKIYTLLGESQEAFNLVLALSHTNVRIGRLIEKGI